MGRANRTERTAEHPFIRWLDSRGLTLSYWAKQHGINRVTAISWFSAGPPKRRPPLHIRELIERESGGAISISAWE